MTLTTILCLLLAAAFMGALDEWHQRRRDRQQIKRWRWPATNERSK